MPAIAYSNIIDVYYPIWSHLLKIKSWNWLCAQIRAGQELQRISWWLYEGKEMDGGLCENYMEASTEGENTEEDIWGKHRGKCLERNKCKARDRY